MNNSIFFPKSNIKLTFFIFFSLLFVIGSIWLFQKEDSIEDYWIRLILIQCIVCPICLLGGVLGILFFSTKLMDKTAGITISKEGIIDNFSAHLYKLIPWSSIVNIYETKLTTGFRTEAIITIDVNNTDEIIAKQKNILLKLLLKGNNANNNSPIHFSANALKVKHDVLYDTMLQYYSEYGLQSQIEEEL
jgi:hypothetical protein